MSMRLRERGSCHVPIPEVVKGQLPIYPAIGNQLGFGARDQVAASRPSARVELHTEPISAGSFFHFNIPSLGGP